MLTLLALSPRKAVARRERERRERECEREKEREGERERQRETERDRETETETERELRTTPSVRQSPMLGVAPQLQSPTDEWTRPPSQPGQDPLGPDASASSPALYLLCHTNTLSGCINVCPPTPARPPSHAACFHPPGSTPTQPGHPPRNSARHPIGPIPQAGPPYHPFQQARHPKFPS